MISRCPNLDGASCLFGAEICGTFVKSVLETSLESVSIWQQQCARTVTMALCRKAWTVDGMIRSTSNLQSTLTKDAVGSVSSRS